MEKYINWESHCCNPDKCDVIVYEASGVDLPLYSINDRVSKISIRNGCETKIMTPNELINYLNFKFHASIPTDPLNSTVMIVFDAFDLCKKEIVGTSVDILTPTYLPPACNANPNCPVGGVNAVLTGWEYVTLGFGKELLFKTVPSGNPVLTGGSEEARPRILPITVRFIDLCRCASFDQKYTHESVIYAELIASEGFRENQIVSYQSKAALDLTNFINPPLEGPTATVDTIVVIKFFNH